jgi:CBS domain containing-hemolysin-like protein
MEIEIAIAVLILFVLVFLASVDMAFGQLSDVGLRRLTSEAEEETGSRSAAFLRQILKNRPRFRFTLSASIQILLIIFSVLVTLIVNNFFQTYSWLIFSLLIGLVLSGIFRQIIPRLLTFKNPEQRLLTLLPLVRPLYTVMSFIADPLERFLRSEADIEKTIAPGFSDEKDDDDDDADHFQALIEVGEAEGILEEDERELLETMVEFGDTRTSEVMTPRTAIIALAIDTTVREARDLIIDQKYSRVPVYSGRIDHIEGMIYVRDLLVSWAENKETQPISEILRPVFFVPETKPIDEVLEEMQKQHVSMFIVIDEYGGVAGLITVEDIVEEIVGEIEDEDIEAEEVIEIIEGEDGYFDVLGSTEIDKIEHILDLEIEEDDDDFNTIAGLVMTECGYVPKKGEKFTIRGLDIEVLKCDERKIELLRLRKAKEKAGEDDAS